MCVAGVLFSCDTVPRITFFSPELATGGARRSSATGCEAEIPRRRAGTRIERRKSGLDSPPPPGARPRGDAALLSARDAGAALSNQAAVEWAAELLARARAELAITAE
jgi:hypothetical protein